MRQQNGNPVRSIMMVMAGILMITSNPTRISAAEPASEDAKYEENLPKGIFQRQNEFEKVVMQIQNEIGDRYIGGEVGDLSKVYIKGAAPKAVKDIVGKSSLKIEIVDNQRYSVMELSEKLDQASDILSKAGYLVDGGSLDIPDQITVSVGLKKGLPATEAAIMKLLPADLAKITQLDLMGGENQAPGMTGYVVEVNPKKKSILVTSYEPERGRLSCNNAIYFGTDTLDLKPGQCVKVWFNSVAKSFPGQSMALRTEVVARDAKSADEAAAIALALKKRAQAKTPGYPFVTSVKNDTSKKEWTVAFAGGPDGKADPSPIIITAEELKNSKKK